MSVFPAIWPKLIRPNSDDSLGLVLEHFTIPTYRVVASTIRSILEDNRPDLLLCDFMSNACSDLAQTLDIPYAVTMSGLPNGVSDASYTVGWNGKYLVTTTEGLSLWKRFDLKVLTPLRMLRSFSGPLRQLQQLQGEAGMRVVQGPPAVQHAKALKIINTFLGFESARPIDPSVLLVGPIQHHVNKTLPQDINDWIASRGSSSSSSSPRIVYAAFGTHVDLPDEVLKGLYMALVAALNAGDVDGVIWAVSGIRRDKFPADVDSRVLLLPFAPQKAVLGHPAVQLFISHGGAESSHESMFEGKPMLIVPFFGDQPMNAAKLKAAGMAEFVPQYQVTAAKIQALLHRMLHSQHSGKYQAAAARMKALVNTLAKHNTASAADMLEFYAEYGWDHLIPASTRMSWWQGTNADLYGVVGISGAEAFYGSGSDVTSLTANNFDSRVKSGGVWLVEFYAPWCGHCQALTPAWEQTAKALKGIVNVAAVDADEHKSLAGEHGIRGFPTIKFFYVQGGKIKSSDYNGGRSATELVSFALDKAKAYAFKQLGEKPPSGTGGGGGGGCGAGAGGGGGGGESFYDGTDVVTLTDKNFNEEVLDSDDIWFVEFYAPWCGHCKALKPAWIESATQMKGRVKFGAVDCTGHASTCGQYGVQGYPTIKIFGSNKNDPSAYNGGRDSGSLTAEATRLFAEVAPPKEVRELYDQAVFESECLGLGDPGLEKVDPAQLCYIAFLPNILDSKAEGRNGYIESLKTLANDFKDRKWSYLWAEGGKQPELEASLGVGGFGYPAFVALKPTDNKFSTMRSAFATPAIKEFVRNLRYEPVQAVAGGKLGEVQHHEPWDGQDAAVEAEDEFSLDDIMGGDDDDSAGKEL
eukprot:gene9043-9214_t